VSFFLKLYQQRLVSLENAVASLTSNLDAITTDLEEHLQVTFLYYIFFVIGDVPTTFKS